MFRTPKPLPKTVFSLQKIRSTRFNMPVSRSITCIAVVQAVDPVEAPVVVLVQAHNLAVLAQRRFVGSGYLVSYYLGNSSVMLVRILCGNVHT